MNDDTVGALLNCFAPVSVGRAQTPILQCAVASFSALVLLDCAHDMDRKFVINELLYYLL